MTPRARRFALVQIGLALALAAAIAGDSLMAPQDTGADWKTFEGTWSAAGERRTLPAGDSRTAAIVRVSGALVLTAGDGLRRGFRAEAIGFDDGSGAGTGRAVWTDDRGDQIFSAVAGQIAQTERQVTATITGGTGRYAGITGSYSFTWRFLLPRDDAGVQANAVKLSGRYRHEPPR